MQTFDEFRNELNEMAIAMKGDMEEDIQILNLSIQKLHQSYMFISNVTTEDKKVTLQLYQYVGAKDHYKLGRSITLNGELKFAVYLEIDLSPVHSLLGLKNVFNVDSVAVSTTNQGAGIAKALYLHFVKKLKFNILGDEEQYFGARKLWTKLSQTEDTTVDIIDIDKNEYIEKNVILHHGHYDHEFDDRVWSYGHEKKHIRLILKDIK